MRLAPPAGTGPTRREAEALLLEFRENEREKKRKDRSFYHMNSLVKCGKRREQRQSSTGGELKQLGTER